MFSIKKSFADCSSCELLSAPSCIFETNSEDNLKNVEIVFVAENPGKTEIEREIPLIGKAGSLFRIYFDKYILRNNFKYLLTNCVLCATIDPISNKTMNPTDSTIERCKINCFEIIKTCNPKLIVLMGNSPLKAFGISNGGIKEKRGNIFKWNNFSVLVTYHPSYIIRNRNTKEEKDFELDLKKSAEILGFNFDNNSDIEKIENKTNNNTGKGKLSYKIPKKYYSEDYSLVDIQYINKTKEVVYIFRNKKRKKSFYKTNDNYYYYICEDKYKAEKIIPYEKLNYVIGKYSNKENLDPEITYEGDLRICTKHAIDYYLNREVDELPYELKTMFVDIEIYTGDAREFPDAVQVKYPICSITYWENGNLITFITNINNQKIDTLNGEVVIFSSEKEMLSRFIDVVRESDIDCMTGWSFIDFDLSYIYNRANKIGLDPNKMSRLNNVFVNREWDIADINGINVFDMLFLYKNFTFEKKESYKLGAISQIELGHTKLELNLDIETFSDVYEENINRFIEYNRKDVSLLVELEKKLGHIKLLTELRKICKNSFKGVHKSMGQVDSILCAYLKEKNLSFKNAAKEEFDGKIPGAYVKEPDPGIYDYFVDFDYSSLYPSIILTYNIGVNTFIRRFEDFSLGYDFIYDPKNLPEKIEVVEYPTFKNEKKIYEKEEFLNLVKSENLICTINGCFYKSHYDEKSIFSEVLELLLDSRKIYKTKMFEAKKENNEILENVYSTKQLVYKVLANAIYGVLLNKHFRFFNPHLGTSITLSGREISKTAIVCSNEYINKLKTNNFNDPFPLSKNDMFTSENLSIKTPHILASDTDSVFVCYESLIDYELEEDVIIKNIKKWNDEILNFLNNDIIKSIVKKHNTNDEFNRLTLKNELLCKRGNFMAKKRYTIFVIEQEGQKVEEIVNRGFEVRRSDYPAFTKESLNELVELVLKSKKFSIKEIHEFIEKKRKEFIIRIENGDKSIARPMTFTKPASDYKVISEHVKGMMNWNSLIYNAFFPGTKGYVFKLKGFDPFLAPPEIGKKYQKEFIEKGKSLDVIAIPYEEQKLPNYFIVDKIAILNFSWEDRYKLFLSSIIKPVSSIINF